MGAAGLAAGLLPGSNSRAYAQSATPLRWMAWGGAKAITKVSQAISAGIPAMASQYAVETIDGGQGDQDVAAAIRLALASGQDLPEIVMLNRTQVAEFAVSGELLPLDHLYADIKDDVYPGALELVKANDQFVAVPFELKSKLFYYRSDLYEQAGVDATAIKSSEDFLNAGRALAKVNTNLLNLGPQPAGYWTGELLSAYDGSRFFANEDGTYSIADSAALKDVFTFIKSLYDSGLTIKVDDWSSDWQPAIADGKVASFLNASWLKHFLPTFAPEQSGKWKVDLWPQLSPLADQRYGSEAGGSVFVVLKRSANAEAAADYLRKVFLEREGAMTAYKGFGTTPMIKSAKDEFLELSKSPVRPDGMSDADFALLPGNYFGPEVAIRELESYEYVKVLQYDPQASKGLDIMNQWLRKFVNGEADLQAALGSAQSDMEMQIGNPFEI
jgi:ABC-type glycerol-3-phosphate transport system substrate-binding protein